ncbi:12928_t:CDS:2 [Ambispora gerdemannii]|uniref:12928_t:CDS:1 n=1 Tax=Ambispora gerdemannii TaxID=144530 RepID=A0A9N8W991_9GLOM|nr:12928_t:CDS:2 [Ambispora gerdemannii]
MEANKSLLDEIFAPDTTNNNNNDHIQVSSSSSSASTSRPTTENESRLRNGRSKSTRLQIPAEDNELSPTIISSIPNLSPENFGNEESSDENSDLSDDESESSSPTNNYGLNSLSIASPPNGSSSRMASSILEQPIAPAEQMRAIVVNRPTAQMIENFRLPNPSESMKDEEILDFVMKPVPQGQKVLCKITRIKDGFGKFYPQYELFVEDLTDQTRTFMLAARKRKKSKSSHYVITTDRLSASNTIKHIIGKVRNPFKREQNVPDIPLREELGAVVYDPNILGFKGPRKMTVLLTGMTKTGERPEFRPKTEEETLIGKFKSGSHRDILVLHNKSPQWNEETQSYVLNFSGRVTLASVKNFQIVHDNDLDYIIMQFGRVSDDTFTMDFMYPMCLLQAFAIALSSFDAKLACE